MDKTTLTAFVVMVFGAVFFIAQVLIVPTFGTSGQEMKRLKKRLAALEKEELPDLPMLLLRERFRRKPSALENMLAWIPGMERLARSLEEPGQPVPAYSYILASLIMAMAGGSLAWWFTANPWLAAMAVLGVGWLPFLKLKIERNQRFAKFEEQLPGALEVMTRALLAGYPFVETLRQVGNEMDDPIATEFRMAFDEINAGVDIRKALRNMLGRVPSMTLMALITTVALQRETGGNLAESLTNIGGVIRGRDRFQRKVTTLTAEGRLSAWVLALMPFVLFGMLSFMMPDKIKDFVADPAGQHMIFIGLGLMAAGILWLRALLNIEI